MIVLNSKIDRNSLLVETTEGWQFIKKDDYEIWVDDNDLRHSLEETFNGEYFNRIRKLSWEEYYSNTKIHRDLEWYLASL